jgi:predicted regulator of Ras-like GTPase activity (Roadblock/LC7/MglB family)
MFEEHLQKLVDNVEGGQAALLMGFDGIEVQSYTREGTKNSGGKVIDAEFVKNVGGEFSFIFGQIRKAAEILEIGGIQEVTIKSDSLVIIIRQLTEDHFAAMVLSESGNFGKARFLLRITAPKILREL